MNLYVCKRILSGECGTTRAQRKRATDLERRDDNIQGALPKLNKEESAQILRGHLADRMAAREHRRKYLAKRVRTK